MLFLDISYSHVFWTYQGLELRFSKTARELPGEIWNAAEEYFSGSAKRWKFASRGEELSGSGTFAISAKNITPHETGMMLLLIKNESRISSKKRFALLLTELETGINFNFRKRSLLFFTLFSHVRVLLLSNFAYLAAGINYNIFVHQLADCKSKPAGKVDKL